MKKSIILWGTVFLCWFCLSNCNNSSAPETPPTEQTPTSKESEAEKDTLISVPEKPSTTSLPNWPAKRKHQKGKLYPFDEGDTHPGFKQFRGDLYSALQKKDTEFLLNIIDEKIHFSFGMEAGKEEFLKTYQLLTHPKESMIWNHLAATIRLGGIFTEENKNEFTAPYLFVIDDIQEPYEEGVITGENVRLRDTPSTDGKIVKALSWDWVKLLPNQPYKGQEIDGELHSWLHIEDAFGEQGYVYGKYLRLPIDYRASFQKKNGQWRMTMFIAGD